MPSRTKTGVRGLAPHPPLRDYYPTAKARRGFVVSLFDRTAPHYERINNLMSLGSGARYRRDALRRAGLERDMTLLDVAVGTGLMARAAHARSREPRQR